MKFGSWTKKLCTYYLSTKNSGSEKRHRESERIVTPKTMKNRNCRSMKYCSFKLSSSPMMWPWPAFDAFQEPFTTHQLSSIINDPPKTKATAPEG